MKFVRKIMDTHEKYGQLTLPKAVYDCWTARGYSHVEIDYDQTNEALIVSPI